MLSSQLTGLGVDDECPPVHRLDGALEATERVHQVHLHAHEQIGAPALEHGVRALVEDDDHVARLHAQLLVPLRTEPDLLTVLHAWRGVGEHGNKIKDNSSDVP